MNDPFASSRRFGKVILAAIVVRVAYSLMLLATSQFVAKAVHDGRTLRTVIQAESILRSVLTVLVVLLFMIWTRGEIVALRASGVETKTTPLMAILGWFIPFANLVFPCLAVREVYRQRLPRASGALPILWWVSYIALIVTNNVPRLPFPLGLLVVLGSFGLMFAVILNVIGAPAVPRLAPSTPPPAWQPQPMAAAWPPPR